MKREKLNIAKQLRPVALGIITSALLSVTTAVKAQDPEGPPPPPVGSYCPENSISFTPQIGIGTLNKIVIGGTANNDGTICWNCYNDNSVYGKSNAFNMPNFTYAAGYPIPNFSSRITQDLVNSVMRWQVGVATCYNQVAWNNGISIRTDGSVGIGTDATFGYKLAVNGAIACKNDVFLTQTGLPWPDYVFTKSYALIPLLELEKQIDSLGHLPKMPSADEVENNGLSLANVTTTIVQKVEELTLYTIEQQKQLVELKKRNELIEKQNADLKTNYEELLKRLDSLLNEKE